MRISSCLSAFLGVLSLTSAQAQQHAFDVKDDIALWRINSPHVQPLIPGSGIAEPSPDGRFVAIVTTRGVLATDLIQSRLSIFDLREVATFLRIPNLPSPKPRVIAAIESYPHHNETDAYAPVIKDVRWSSDSTRVFFRKENMQGNYELCTAGPEASRLQCLTPPSETVDHFDVLGATVVFTAGDPAVHLIDPGHRISRDATDVTGARLQEILFPNEVVSHAPALFRIYVLTLGPKGPSIQTVPKYSLLNIPFLSAIYPFEASPDGKSLVDLEPVTTVPNSWSNYATAPGAEQLRLTGSNDPRLLRADNILRPLEYALIDLKTGREAPLLGAPNARNLGFTADRNRVAWSPDGDQVVVTNTFLPVSGQGNTDEPPPCGAAVIQIKSLRRECLYFEDGTRQSDSPRIEDIAYGRQSDEINILLRSSVGTATIRIYRFRNGNWRLSSSAAVDAKTTNVHAGLQQSPVTVFVRQSLNDPPAIWAIDGVNPARELWDPNPQLRQMQLGQASPYEWRDDSGRDWSGILVKPVDYRPGVRYPLVIQLYNYNAGEFITDGLYPTAFAAREFADVGFVVLQVKKRPDTVSEQDPQIHLEAYSSAIERLSDEGLIDRTRVGVVGFSLTCWYVVNALIKRPDLFAAATIADGIDYSYMQYMLFAVEFYPLQRQMDKVRGHSPIGAAALRHWLDEAPGFNLDRVRTPVRIEGIGPSSVLQEWELYSSLRLQRKPVDLVYFPSGTHIHQLPLERLESQQGDIDWFRFWLQNEEDPDPSKRTEYQRWEAMRSARDHEQDNRSNARQ